MAGQDVRLDCVTLGAPPPAPTWTFRGRQLGADPRWGTDVLTPTIVNAYLKS